MKKWIIEHKIVGSGIFVLLILLSLLAYDIFNSGETNVRRLEVSERECNFWERVVDFWPDENGCKVKDISEVE